MQKIKLNNMKEFDPFNTPVTNNTNPSNNTAIVVLGALSLVTLAALVMFYIHNKQQEEIEAMK
jgi:LPXTG-motif cell wall-anchored protein